MDRFGKQRGSGGFESEEGSFCSTALPAAEILWAPPCETMQQGRLWAIKGIYEHICQKIGFRRLDKILDGADLLVFPKGKPLLKERFFRDLMEGKIKLQATQGNEIAAAQPDIKKLSLVQLLRVRVQTLDYDPKSHGEAAKGFMHSLDHKLFEKLGQHIASSGLLKDDKQPQQIGYEAITMMAAAGAITSPVWWAWWPPGTEKQRVFFDSQNFTIAETFPLGGVLEVAIFSKADQNSPGLKWMDWQIKVVEKEANLVKDKPNKGAGVGGCVSLDMIVGTRERLKSTDSAASNATSHGRATPTHG